jgi:hypothetical protein
MSFKLKCHTLFDITKTGNIHRKPPINGTIDQTKRWEKTRNTQTNFDTIIQVLSLRSQPEDITDPVQEIILFDTSLDMFGFLFDNEDVATSCWSFTVSIPHNKVYDDGINELGNLYKDCDGVPMIKVGTEWEKLPNFLDTTPELKNIHFEVINDE